MSESKPPINWEKTTFDGSRREQLRQAQSMTVRQRLEALNELTELSERMHAMARPSGTSSAHPPQGVRETQFEFQAKSPEREVALAGCAPVPLANYLKALGTLRLLSSKYPGIRGCWRGNQFVLQTSLDRDETEQFFLNDYEPTPIMAPWNGGSGFFDKDNKTALESIKNGTNSRFELYRQCLDIADQSLNGMDRGSSPKGETKTALLARVRGLLPDAALGWFDASVSLAGDAAQYPPLLGTGGNDGRLDFTNNFMQRLIEVITPNQGDLPTMSHAWLTMALFAEAAPGLLNKSIGQFSPGQAGGPNAGTGFEASASVNPWDFVLMIEGALPFAAATVRRNADDPFGVLSYPFTVRAVGAGAGSIGEGDAANARGELWMPLWRQPASYLEIRSLMAEGRVTLGKTPARDALDFVRGVHHLGGYRGVRAFQRFGLLMRSGKAYLATPLARVEIDDENCSRWLDELDGHEWLTRFRRFAQGDRVANRFLTLRKRLEDMLFALSGHEPTAAETQALLMLLGDIQVALSNSPKAMEAVRPIPRLSEQWVSAADDGTPAFRIAKALAGLHGIGDEPLPLRTQIFPVHRRFDQWMTAEAGEKVRIFTGQKGRLVDTLRALLNRRLWLAEKLELSDKPLDSPAGATVEDITAFLHDEHMDKRIADLLPGLCLCAIPMDTDRSAGDGALPAAFGLMKLSLTPDRTLRRLDWLGEKDHMPVPAGMLAQLAAGNHGNRAVAIAWRRLRSSGLAPLISIDALPDLGGIKPARAAAALLVPLRYGATGALACSVLKTPKTDTEAA